ncbi:hypothetical protein ACLOJK_023112, partial [Asimina triloba]
CRLVSPLPCPFPVSHSLFPVSLPFQPHRLPSPFHFSLAIFLPYQHQPPSPFSFSFGRRFPTLSPALHYPFTYTCPSLSHLRFFPSTFASASASSPSLSHLHLRFFPFPLALPPILLPDQQSSLQIWFLVKIFDTLSRCKLLTVEISLPATRSGFHNSPAGENVFVVNVDDDNPTTNVSEPANPKSEKRMAI